MARSEVTDAQTQLTYHSDWRTSLIHFLTACNSYHQAEKLSERVGMKLSQVQDCLNFLNENGLVDFDRKAVRFKSGVGHLSRGSPILPVFQNGWRQAAVQNAMRSNGEQSIHFTNVQTIGLEDIPKALELGRRFARAMKDLCEVSKSEEVIALNLDLFIPEG